jgi:SAM-dependent methyltransferase
MKLLEGSLLRRLAAPLRRRAPGVYSALNRVRGALVTRGTCLAPYQALALRKLRETCLAGDPGTTDVLELGSDLEMKVLEQVMALGVRSAVGVNSSEAFWREQAATELGGAHGARLLKGDACDLAFDDGSFDAVFSVAAFEHIRDVPAALREIHRVLRPGGKCFTSFGPLWSGCRGHHVNAKADGAEIRHADPLKNSLPDFSHLLLSPEEMRAAVAARFTPAMGDAVVESVYRSPEINRLFFHEYEAMLRAGPLRLVNLWPIPDPVDEALERLLRFKYPNESRFDVTNAEFLLEKTAL